MTGPRDGGRRAAPAAALLLAVVVLASGCAGTSAGGTTQAERPAHRPTGQPGASGTTGPSAGPTGVAPRSVAGVPRPPDPVAPPFTPVARHGTVPSPSIRAEQRPFTRPVSYPDHVRLTILGVSQGVTTGRGPGALPGRPVTTFRVRFVDGSARTINLDRVVVTLVHGPDRRLSAPVYRSGSTDFHGTVQPRGSTVATYSFSIPEGQLGEVTMRVDFDGLHAAARFHGSVT